VLMDVALHRQPVTFVLNRAGVTGPDGPSHHGMWDMSFLQLVPGATIAAPRDATRVVSLLRACLARTEGPNVLRFPKAKVGPDIDAIETIDGVDVLARGESPDVLPVNKALLTMAAEHRLVATLEDGVRVGGVGSRLGLELADARIRTPVRTFGLQSEFLAQGTRDGLLREQGLSDQEVARALVEAISNEVPEPVVAD